MFIYMFKLSVTDIVIEHQKTCAWNGHFDTNNPYMFIYTQKSNLKPE